jgi:pimeloyl-ACP methyl ester carboxylesterase
MKSIKKDLESHDGTIIHYEMSMPDAKDRTIIFLHGLGGDLTAWEKERKYFNDLGINTLAMDLRGHGYSGRSNDRSFYSMINFAKDILALMREERLKDVTLVGHCFGGMISLILEGHYPKSSKNLVLVDTSFKPPYFAESFNNHPFMLWMLSLITQIVPDIGIPGHTDFKKFIGTKDFDIERIANDILHTSLKSYLLMLENLIEYNATTLLSKIMVPTLIVDGVNDSIFPPEVARHLRDRIKRSELDIIPMANHILVVNNPQDLSRDIAAFLVRNKFI